MSEPCGVFEPMPTKEKSFSVKIEIVDFLSLLFSFLPVYRKVYKLFSISSFELSAFLFIDGELAKTKGKFCSLPCFKDILLEGFIKRVYYVLPFIKRKFDRWMFFTKVYVIISTSTSPINLCSTPLII